MKILIVWASPNENGLTASAKDKVLNGIKSAGGEAEVLHLNRSNLKSCITCNDGWGKCRTEGRCIIQDDFSNIYDKLIAADGIVWITPVYWHDLAERLKYFLDRLRRCETAYNHSLQGKKCLLIACAGGTGLGAIQCLDKLEETLNHMHMSVIDRLPVIRFNKSYMLPALSEAGQSFVGYLRKN